MSSGAWSAPGVDSRSPHPRSDAGTRDVAVPPHLIPAIQEHLATHVGPEPDALLFPAQHGGHLQPSTLYRHFYPPATRPGGRTCVSTTSVTLARCWRPPRVPHWPNSWPGWATPHRGRRCATSTPHRAATRRSRRRCRRSHKDDHRTRATHLRRGRRPARRRVLTVPHWVLHRINPDSCADAELTIDHGSGP